jgi:hypothetical protein
VISAIDEGFIRRVYITSAYVWAFGLLASWSVSGFRAALGWTVGSAISLGLLRGIDWFIRGTVRPSNTRARRSLPLVALLHWPVLIAVLAAGVWFGRGHFSYIVAFCAGLVLTQGVIILKVIGMLVNQRLNK